MFYETRTIRLHPQAEQMRALLQKESIAALYHYTYTSNLPLILELGGLKSKAFLKVHQLQDRVETNGDLETLSLDYLVGNWDRVRLIWCDLPPMFFRFDLRKQRCLLEINAEVALGEDVVFTDRNSHDSFAARADGLAGLQKVDFTAVRHSYPCPTEVVKRRKQAEVLVPEVPLSEIVQVYFWTPGSIQEAKRLCADYPQFLSLFRYDPNFGSSRNGQGPKSPSQLDMF